MKLTYSQALCLAYSLTGLTEKFPLRYFTKVDAFLVEAPVAKVANDNIIVPGCPLAIAMLTSNIADVCVGVHIVVLVLDLRNNIPATRAGGCCGATFLQMLNPRREASFVIRVLALCLAEGDVVELEVLRADGAVFRRGLLSIMLNNSNSNLSTLLLRGGASVENHPPHQ